MTKKDERMVVVLTAQKEIFCGWTTDTSGERINLRAARQAVYYSADTHGLLGLAAHGPARGSRIGPAATVECRSILNVIECSSVAVSAWEGAKWE